MRIYKSVTVSAWGNTKTKFGAELIAEIKRIEEREEKRKRSLGPFPVVEGQFDSIDTNVRDYFDLSAFTSKEHAFSPRST